METLGYEDTNLHERGYPILSTGYYVKDTNFGNPVREAILGYKLVAYETQDKHDGSLRGYGHISKMGDTHDKPMGSAKETV